MAFNKGYELKKFEAHWEKLRIEYAAAGMAEDAIQKMYDYDRQQFNSERTCIERTQEFTAPAYESTEEEASPLMLRYQEAITTTDTYHETKRSFAWIGEIEDENAFPYGFLCIVCAEGFKTGKAFLSGSAAGHIFSRLYLIARSLQPL